MAKRHFTSSDFQMQETFHSTDFSVYSSRPVFFFWLGLRLLCARLAVHSFAVNSVFGSLKSKPQRIHWLCSVRYNFIHFFAVLYKADTRRRPNSAKRT